MYPSINPGVVNIKDISFEDILPIVAEAGFGAIDFDPVKIEQEVGISGAIDLMSQYGVLVSNFNCPVKFSMSDEDFNDSFSKLKTSSIILFLSSRDIHTPATNKHKYPPAIDRI